VTSSDTSHQGVTAGGIDTPALLLDRSRLLGNIRRMAEFAADRPVGLRPHTGAHHCVAVARLQIEHGACGVTSTRLDEAQTMVDGGLDDIFLANEVVGAAKIRRLIDLADRCTLAVAVDDPDNVAELSAAAAATRFDLRCLVEVDVGMGRCGVAPGEPALALARLVDDSPGLTFGGLHAFEGHLQEVAPYDQRRARARDDMKKVTDTRATIEDAGLPVPLVTGGGTGTHAITGVLPGIDELQPGSYVTMDAAYRRAGAPFENALTVLSTVVSRPTRETAVIDAGYSAVAPEFGEPEVLRGGAAFVALSEEHGTLRLTGAGRDLAVGDTVELVPGHGSTTVGLHDRFHVMEDGRLQDVWPIARPRGAGGPL